MKARAALVVGTAVATMLAGAVPAALADARKGERKKPAAVTAPANDSFAMGIDVIEMPFESTVDLTEASLEKNEPAPSCSPATRTVWYRYAPSEDVNVLMDLSAKSPVSVAVHSGSDLATLSEVACAPAAPEAQLALPLTAGNVYFVQVAAQKARTGLVDLSLQVDTWRYEQLAQREVTVPVPTIDQSALVIDGKPREGKPGIYDLTVKAGGVTVGPYGLETDPVKLPAIHQELVKVPGQKVQVSITSSYRYDSAQGRCVLYQGDDCLASLPVSGQSSWYTGGDASEAELVVTLRVMRNDDLLAERTVTVPVAGQLLALLP